MNELQDDLLLAISALAPEDIVARQHAGAIYFQTSDFRTVLAVSYVFDPRGASFHLGEPRRDFYPAVARLLGFHPAGFSPFGWTVDFREPEHIPRLLRDVALALRQAKDEANVSDG